MDQPITATKPESTIQLLAAQESSSLTILFGVLGIIVAAIRIAVAVFQLRHMRQRPKMLQVFELA
jgi:hypothetical protein